MTTVVAGVPSGVGAGDGRWTGGGGGGGGDDGGNEHVGAGVGGAAEVVEDTGNRTDSLGSTLSLLLP